MSSSAHPRDAADPYDSFDELSGDEAPKPKKATLAKAGSLRRHLRSSSMGSAVMQDHVKYMQSAPDIRVSRLGPPSRPGEPTTPDQHSGLDLSEVDWAYYLQDASSGDSAASEQSAYGAHDFDKFKGLRGLCVVCGKVVVPLLNQEARQCRHCGTCAHESCWNRVQDIDDGDGTQSAMYQCHRNPAGSQWAAQRFTKSSMILVKRRFEAELKSPQFKGGLDDDMYARALKTFIDELQSAKYKVKDGRGTTVSDVSAMYMKVLVNCLKRGEPATRTAASPWKPYYQAFKTTLEDYDFYAQDRVPVTSLLPVDIALQLALADAELYNAIRREELENLHFNDKDRKHELAPNVMAFIQRFNEITWFVVSEVLRYDTAKARALTVAHFISTAQRCQQLHDFHALKAILAALQSASISRQRLKRTWELVPKEALVWFEELSALMTQDDNYSRYRQALSTLPPDQFCVPFIGVFLTDLTYTADAFKEQPEVCRVKVRDIVDVVTFFQFMPTTYEPIFALQPYLQNLKYETSDEQENFNKSLEREPRARKTSAPVVSMELKPQGSKGSPATPRRHEPLERTEEEPQKAQRGRSAPVGPPQTAQMHLAAVLAKEATEAIGHSPPRRTTVSGPIATGEAQGGEREASAPAAVDTSGVNAEDEEAYIALQQAPPIPRPRPGLPKRPNIAEFAKDQPRQPPALPHHLRSRQVAGAGVAPRIPSRPTRPSPIAASVPADLDRPIVPPKPRPTGSLSHIQAPPPMSGLGSEDAQTLWSILKSIQRREEQRLREHAEDSAVSRDCMAQLADLGAALGLLETNHQ